MCITGFARSRLLVEAATTAQRYDPSWHQQYVRLSMTKHHGVAKVAIAHKLAVRLYWMLRSGQDYGQIKERGSQHAGENLADVLRRRNAALPSPVQMCDALSRNTPKLPQGAEILLANCLAHGRRQFVEVAANFPAECRYVLEMLGEVYRNDDDARQQKMTPDERLRFHQQHSRPIMDKLHSWMGRSWRKGRRSRTPDWDRPSVTCCATGSR